MADKKFHAIVLAGDRGADDPLAGALGVKRKALLPLNGKPMLSYVLAAVKGSDNISNVSVVANDVESLKAGLGGVEGISFEEGAHSPVSSVIKAVQGKGKPILIVTADNPLITITAIDEFCLASLAQGVDITVGFATKSSVLKAFPKANRTFIRLRGESYTGCNMFALTTDNSMKALDFWLGIEAERKKAWKLIAAFGWFNLIKTLCGIMSLDKAMISAGKVIGAETKAIILTDPALSMDVDKPVHVGQVEELLKKG
jgi:GTP:adenosylcobinamide-phosphate guanylyltransferase